MPSDYMKRFYQMYCRGVFFSVFALTGVYCNYAQELKVMTYNIHYGVGMDGKKDLARIAAVINDWKPDIVGLQEVSDSVMMAELGQLTGMEAVFGASTEAEPPNLYRLLGIPVPEAQLHYGDGILSRYPMKYLGNHAIPSASSSRYEAMAVDVDLSERWPSSARVRFITTHFDYLETIGSRRARQAAVEVLEEAFVDERQDVSYILTGDLNATPDDLPLQLLRGKGWVLEDFGRDLFTVPVTRPAKQIDYVLFRPKSSWTVTDVMVIDEQMASDHLPVLMIFESR